MAGYSHAKLVAFLKKNDEAGQSAAAKHLGISIGQLPMLQFCIAQVEAGVYDELPATTKSVTAARDKEGNRWELLAARTGESVSAVKKLYSGDPSESYTGKGRNHKNGQGSAPTGKAAGKAPAAAAKKSKATRGKSTGPVRAKTRAQRMARAGDPS
jgi:hypothetical protein